MPLIYDFLGFVYFTLSDFLAGEKALNVLAQIKRFNRKSIVEINKYKFNHCSVPSGHVRLQTNNINLSLRLTNELRDRLFFIR